MARRQTNLAVVVAISVVVTGGLVLISSSVLQLQGEGKGALIGAPLVLVAAAMVGQAIAILAALRLRPSSPAVSALTGASGSLLAAALLIFFFWSTSLLVALILASTGVTLGCIIGYGIWASLRPDG